MGLFTRRRQHPSRSLGLVPYPDADLGYLPGPVTRAHPLYAPMGNIHPSEITGRFGAPMPTQVANYWPGVQMKCGVEGTSRRFQVIGAGDVPYWLQTQRGGSVGLQRTGAAPSGQLGPATTSALLGPARQERASRVQAMAAGLLGW